ncbi:hypothetical protein [Kocuria rhizophila]|uniref:hypothetical protein n=1 Tax=Kocuria rhizophila TaxID=72000 RepID=UPI000A62907A|nr:hypothetical protein [Kocuria rhizophila]
MSTNWSTTATDGITITDEDILALLSNDKPSIRHWVNRRVFNEAVRTGSAYTGICGTT